MNNKAPTPRMIARLQAMAAGPVPYIVMNPAAGLGGVTAFHGLVTRGLIEVKRISWEIPLPANAIPGRVYRTEGHHLEVTITEAGYKALEIK